MSDARAANRSFSLDVGQVSGADVGTGTPVSFSDADAVSLTLTNVTLFAGVGGSLLDNDGGTPTPNDYSDDTVQNGTLGFGGSISGNLSVVEIGRASCRERGAQGDERGVEPGWGLGEWRGRGHAHAGELQRCRCGVADAHERHAVRGRGRQLAG